MRSHILESVVKSICLEPSQSVVIGNFEYCSEYLDIPVCIHVAHSSTSSEIRLLECFFFPNSQEERTPKVALQGNVLTQTPQ